MREPVREGLVRLADAADLRRGRLEGHQVDELEVAVRENARLSADLADVVGSIEADLVPILEALHGPDADTSRTTSM